jgi:hypothetical protein
MPRTILRSTATIATLLLTLALAAPVLGGLQCQLQATVGGGSATIVETGETVLIEGTGFAANATVTVTYSVDATVVDDETVMADGTGFFDTSVVPQVGQEGLWTVEADAPKQCVATTAFEVVAPAATPSPSPSATPAATPVQAEIPDVATSEPRTPTALLQGAALLTAAAIWLSRRRLARLFR